VAVGADTPGQEPPRQVLDAYNPGAPVLGR